MSKEQTSIGPWLFGPLLLISTLGYGLMNLPHYGAAALGAGGYLAEPAALPIIMPGLVAIYLLAGRFPGKSLIEQSETVLGGLLGRVAGTLYLVMLLLTLTMFTRDMINLIGTYFLNLTPTWFLSLTLLSAAAFLASRGLETVSRFAAFLLIPSLLVLLFLLLTGFQNFSILRVLPVETSPAPLLRGGFRVVYIYYVLGASAIALPMFKPLKSVPRTTAWVLLVCLAFFIAFAFGSIGVYGHDYILRWAWPSMEFVHTIDYPFLLLEQAGLLMLLDWTAIILAATGFLHYLLALGASQVVGKLDYKRWSWILLPVKFGVIIAPQSVAQTKKAFEFVARYGWIAFFAFPPVLFLTAVILKRRGDPVNAE